MVVSFDNEEVGSASRLGADSTILLMFFRENRFSSGLNKGKSI